MTLGWPDLAAVVAVVVAGCGATHFLVIARLRRALAENHREMERRLAALTEAVAMRAPVPCGLATDALEAGEIELETAGGFTDLTQAQPAMSFAVPKAVAAEQKDEEIPVEIHVAITAAAIAALGKHAHVRSARRVPSSVVVNPWTQQGRLIVQSSHNLRTRG